MCGSALSILRTMCGPKSPRSVAVDLVWGYRDNPAGHLWALSPQQSPCGALEKFENQQFSGQVNINFNIISTHHGASQSCLCQTQIRTSLLNSCSCAGIVCPLPPGILSLFHPPMQILTWWTRKWLPVKLLQQAASSYVQHCLEDACSQLYSFVGIDFFLLKKKTAKIINFAHWCVVCGISLWLPWQLTVGADHSASCTGSPAAHGQTWAKQ